MRLRIGALVFLLSTVARSAPAPAAGAPRGEEARKPEGQRGRNAPDLSGAGIRTLGVLGVVAWNEGSTSVGASLYERGLGLLNHEWISTRYLDFLELGGDSGGLRYRADAQLAIGPRWLWSTHHALLARLGARAHVARSVALYTSDVRLPELQLGHQSSFRRGQIDVGAHGSLVPWGRLESSAGRGVLDGARAFGAYGAVAWESFRLDADWSRFRGQGKPHADDLRGHLCWLWSRVMACADGRVLHGATPGDRTRIRGGFVGVSALVGQLEWL